MSIETLRTVTKRKPGGSPIQKRMATMMWGQGHSSPQMVTVRYQVKKGSQHSRKAPITTPSVTKALCSFLHTALRMERLS